MALPITIIIYAFIILIGVVGVPFTMSIQGISRHQDVVSFMTTHESVVKLVSVSQTRLTCDGSSQCIRPIDFSHLKTNVPISFESCRAGEEILRCDNVKMSLSFTSRDLLKIGLRI